MENFNLKKFLVENKLTSNSRLLNEEREQVELFTFGYDLDNVQEVEDYLMDNYEEGVDYKAHVGMGDDTMNALDILNPELLQDKELMRLIDLCDGEGHYGRKGTDYDFVKSPEEDPLVAEVLKYLEQKYQEGVDFEYDSNMQRLYIYDDVNKLSSDGTLVDLLSDVFAQPDYEDGY
jgi:hypothetical protein